MNFIDFLEFPELERDKYISDDTLMDRSVRMAIFNYIMDPDIRLKSNKAKSNTHLQVPLPQWYKSKRNTPNCYIHITLPNGYEFQRAFKMTRKLNMLYKAKWESMGCKVEFVNEDLYFQELHRKQREYRRNKKNRMCALE